MTLKSYVKFEESLTCGLENDMKTSAHFHERPWVCVKIGTLIGSFCPKQKMHELKIQSGVMCNDTEE